MTKKNLIKKYEKKLEYIINPDNITKWEELGFDEKPEEYESIYDYLEHDPDVEYDAEDQIEIGCIKEFLDDLRKLN